MTGDRMVGTAILFRRPTLGPGQASEPDGEFLHVWGETAAGVLHLSQLPVSPALQPTPRRYEWNYVPVGNILKVTPSVRILEGKDREVFHNPAAWDIPFVRMPLVAADQTSASLDELDGKLNPELRRRYFEVQMERQANPQP